MNEKLKLNQKGFTIIELLIAMAIGLMLLATAVYTYSKQDEVIREGNRATVTRGMARLALDEMVQELRKAGFGMEPGNSAASRPAQGVTNATDTSITYLANGDGIMTEVIIDCGALSSTPAWYFWTTKQDGTAGTTGPATMGFAVGDHVSVFDAGRPGRSEFFGGSGLIQVVDAMTIAAGSTHCDGQAIDAGLVNVGVTLTNQYEPVDDNTAVVVHKIITYTYTYNAGTQSITRTVKDGNRTATTTTVANNVAGLTFSYFDASGTALSAPLNATELGNLRRIHIDLTVQNPDDTAITSNLATDVTLRNMGP